MVAKYYIYASGRWCEVDTRRGRVAGWRQRASFCFLRGGRLEVARSAPVLRALRSLAAGAGGAARDAAPLPYSRRHRPRRESVAPAHVCCAHHLHHSRCDLNANELGDKPPPALQAVNTPAAPSTRKRKRSSSEDLPNKAKQAKNVPSFQRSPQKKSGVLRSKDSQSSESSDNVKEQKKEKTVVKRRSKEEEKLVQSLLQSSSDETNEKQKKSQREKPRRSPQKCPQKKSDVLRSKDLQNSESSDNVKEQRKEKTVVKTRSKEEEKLVQSLLQSSSDETNEKQKKSQREKPRRSPQKSPQKKTKTFRTESVEKVVQSLLQTSSSEGNVKEQVFKRPQTARRPKFRNYMSDSSSSVSVRKDGPVKELIIDESDVDMLRNFLSKTVGTVDLDRFDNDDGYKARLFYKLNPLVTLQRSKQMEELLLQKLTLKEFAKQLGLRSVADVTPEKRYRMRHSTRRARQAPSDSDTDKEDVVQPKRRQLWNRDKAVFNSFRSTRASDVRDKPQIPKPVKESSSDSSDSDTEIKQHIKRNLERRASARLNPKRKDDNKSVVVSDESDTDESEKKSRRTRARNEKENDAVMVSDDSDENRGKSRRRTRAEGRAANESVVVSDESDLDENKEKTTRKTRAANKSAKDGESVVVSDESESDSDKNRQKSTKKTKAVNKTAKDGESVVVCDKSDSNTEENTERSTKRTRAAKRPKDNESVVVSDGSESTNANRKPTRRTRSQGADNRVSREHNRFVAISDDADSNGDENRASKATSAKVQSKSVVVSDENNSNTDENQGIRRPTRSTGLDRALKEQNNDSNSKKETGNKTKNEVDRLNALRTTRSSMKGANDSIKEKYKPDTSKKDQPTSSKTETKRKEDKPSKEVTNESKKADTAEDQDKPVISDSDDAFDNFKSSPRKQRPSFGDLMRNLKGRFLKKRVGKSNENHMTADKKDKGNKASENITKANTNESKTRGRKMENGKLLKRKCENKITKTYRIENQTDKNDGGSEHRKDKEKDQSDSNRSEKHRKGNENNNKDRNEKSAVKRMIVKPVNFKKSSVANGREYTSLEDHAIVAWISVGGRERLVNGNAVWRDLQKEYSKITKQTRSWHSLRNRYLRYILPSLAKLALPPAQVSRLRAAAATGKIKCRPGYRRNSIFNVPRVRSASRWPQASSSEDKRERTPPSPRRPRLASPSKLPQPSSSKSSSSTKPSKSSAPTKSPSKPSAPPSPSKPSGPPSPSKRGAAPSPRTTRLRLRASTSTPTPPKKRRIHHL